MTPEGRHRVRAVSAAARTTRNDKEYVEIELHTGDGARLYYKGFLATDSQVERTSNALRACGWDGNDAFQLPGDREVEVVVEHEEYNGKMYERVPFINALTPAVSADRARAMAERLRGGASAPVTRSAPQSRPEPPPISDDDIPF
jgi:hypothetical protein